MTTRTRGFTLIELMIVIAIIAIIAAIAIPGLLQSQRAANERNASASLKTFTSAEADFKANDRDANRVNDYWVEDVKGLYTFSNHLAASASITNMIKLIEISVAGADATPSATNAPGCIAIASVTTPAAKSGFWFQPLDADLSAPAGEQSYRRATNGTASDGSTVSGSYFNTSKFGFITFPDSESAGRSVYIVNESNTIFRRSLTASIRASTANPPGLQTVLSTWPTDTDLKSYWGKMD